MLFRSSVFLSKPSQFKRASFVFCGHNDYYACPNVVKFEHNYDKIIGQVKHYDIPQDATSLSANTMLYAHHPPTATEIWFKTPEVGFR